MTEKDIVNEQTTMSNDTTVYPPLNEYEVVSNRTEPAFSAESMVFYNITPDANNDIERCSFIPQPTEANVKKLESCNKKLKKWNNWMLSTLTVMLFVLVATGIIVAVKMGPQLKKVFRHWTGQLESSDAGPAESSTCANCLYGAEREVDTLSSCADGMTVGNCASAINKLYSSQHTRLKDDEKADDELDNSVSAVMEKLRNEADDRVIYRWRPITHLFLNRQESLNRNDPSGRLLWKGRIEGAPTRKMEVDDPGQIRIAQDGVYHVYTYVIFSTDVINRSQASLTFCLMKNLGRNSEQRKLLETNDTAGTVANLQGTFQLKANDTLSVFAYANYIKEGEEQRMYFGAFLI